MNVKQTKICENCQGSGEVRSWMILKKECPTCLGMGVVVVPELRRISSTFRAKAAPKSVESSRPTQKS